MPGLIDTSMGLRFGDGLQWQAAIGGGGLGIVVGSSAVTFLTADDGVTFLTADDGSTLLTGNN